MRKVNFFPSPRLSHLAGPADKGKSHIPANLPPGSPARSCLKWSVKANVSLGCTQSYFRACSSSSTHVTGASGSRRKAAASRPRAFEGPWKCCAKRGRQGGGRRGPLGLPPPKSPRVRSGALPPAATRCRPRRSAARGSRTPPARPAPTPAPRPRLLGDPKWC